MTSSRIVRADACIALRARWPRTLALPWLLSLAIAGCVDSTGDHANEDDNSSSERDDSANDDDDSADEERDAKAGAPRDGGKARDAGIGDASSMGGRSVDSGLGARSPIDAGSAKADGGGGTPARDAGTGEVDPGPRPSAKKFVGNITTNNQVRPDFADYWDQITPENEGKWGTVEAVHNQMNWSGLDRVHDYAKQHDIVFKQHNFVWGSQQPGWLAGMPAAQQRAEVEEWIRLFCERYPDVELIDVVNEPPPHTTPVYLEALGGAGQSGYDWIVQAFTWARQYCPNAILILNDYNNIEYGGDNARFISIAQAIQAAGAPIDAVGAQAHDAYKLPNGTVQKFLDQLASATGLPVYITEYDINLADDAQQRQIMESQFPMFWDHEAVAGITLWGYVVGATWRPNTGLVGPTGAERPALTWLSTFLGMAPDERPRMVDPPDASFTAPPPEGGRASASSTR